METEGIHRDSRERLLAEEVESLKHHNKHLADVLSRKDAQIELLKAEDEAAETKRWFIIVGSIHAFACATAVTCCMAGGVLTHWAVIIPAMIFSLVFAITVSVRYYA